MSTPIVGRIYRHYKGGVYRVLDAEVRNATNQGEIGAYYEHQSGSTHWRSHEDWVSSAWVHGNEIERFALLPAGSPEETLFKRAG